MRVLRLLLLPVLVVALPLSLTACGSVKGDKEVETSDLPKGPGLFTGKRGGLIIYQR